jgi:hypothetical protein
MYKAIVASCTRSGRKKKTCKRIGAATVNKRRAKRKKGGLGGLGAPAGAHVSMFRRKLASVDSQITWGMRASSCREKVEALTHAEHEYGAALAHLVSVKTPKQQAAMHRRADRVAARLEPLREQVLRALERGGCVRRKR